MMVSFVYQDAEEERKEESKTMGALGCFQSTQTPQVSTKQ